MGYVTIEMTVDNCQDVNSLEHVSIVLDGVGSILHNKSSRSLLKISSINYRYPC